MNYKRSFWALLIVVTVAALGVTVAHYTTDKQPPANTPQQIARTLAATTPDFPVYYPTNLPDGFAIESASVTQDNGVVLYQIRYGTNGTVAVSNQAKPKEVIFDDFYSRLLQNKADVFNTYGKAVIGTAEGKTIGSLVSDKTWVLLTTDSPIDNLAITQLMSSLQPAK